MGYLNNFKFNLESSSYIARSIVTILWETPLLLFNAPVQWMISQFEYVCVYIKINDVTSTCTQNKSHTTHLQIPSLTSVYKIYTINKT